jgi:type II secretory pathway component PulC
MVGLENGYGLTIRNSDGQGWSTIVKTVPTDTAGGLREGDVLVSEAQTGNVLDGPESLDAMLTALVAENQPQARLTVLRNGAQTDAVMQLAQE